MTALVVVSLSSSCALWSFDTKPSTTRTGAWQRSELPCEDSDDPLVAVAMAGTATAVQELLTEGADPNAGDAQGRFALSCAAFSGNADVVEVLLDAGADPDTHSDEGGAPVQAVVIGGSSLAEDGMPIEGVAPTDSEPRLDIITLLAKAKATLDPGVAGAARLGSVVALERLLKLGADPNGVASERSPLLEIAYDLSRDNSGCVERRVCEILDLLLRAGADPDDGGTTRASELSLALRVSRGELNDPVEWYETVDHIERQVPQTGNVPPAAAAALSSNHLVLQRLLDAGADPNALAFDVIPPLWAAAVAGDQEGVRMLLDAGADPTPDVPSWAQPLATATARGHAAIEELLTDAGG